MIMMRTLICVIFLGALSCVLVRGSPEEYSLRNDLFTRYDDIRRRTRPSVHYQDKVTITHGILLQGFEFSTRSKNFDATVIQYMGWNIPELRWDPTRYGNVRSITMYPDQLWLPDIFLHNNEYAGQQKGLKIPVPMLLNSTGYVSWEDPAAISVKCTDKPKTFSGATKDTRWTCQMIFRSWTANINLLDLQVYRNDIDLIEVAPNDAWAITFTHAERVETTRMSQVTRGVDLYYWVGLKGPWL